MSLETNMLTYQQRSRVDKTLRGCTIVATSIAIVPLVLIIAYVLFVGGSALNRDFFTQTYRPPVPAGIDPLTGLPIDGMEEGDLSQVQARGGVLHGIVGTLMVTITALLFSLPIGILAGIFLAEYPDTPFNTFIRFCCDVLSGAPSIVIGVVGFTLIVKPMGSYSGIAGAIALTFLMVPTIARTTEEILKLVPNAVREAAMAMGAPMWYSTLTVVLPAALTGIVTGALLAFARGAGETAPLLLTIQGNSNLSFDLLAPMAALPILTYKYIESPFPAENQLAWGTAFVLMILVLGINLLVRVTTARIKR
ncbi:MAG: phosphate ABC transporter permease PstA [Chloroflexi bacterium]|nr:phosphate ABC transporter permease PstA [Chloroflexota bacterium]